MGAKGEGTNAKSSQRPQQGHIATPGLAMTPGSILRLVAGFMDRPIVIHRPLVEIAGSINAAAMLAQAIYWHERTDDPDGWFWKTQSGWQEEIGLTRSEQEGARRKLLERGLLMEELRGAPAKLYFRVNVAGLESAIAIPVCGKPANKPAENPQTLYKETETTAETTAETTVGPPAKKKAAPPVKAAPTNPCQDWPDIHCKDGDWTVPLPYAEHAEIREFLTEWITRRAANKAKGLPTVFAMRRANAGWWDRYDIRAVLHAIERAAAGEWIGIKEDIAKEWKPRPGSNPSVQDSGVLQSVQRMANLMDTRQEMITKAEGRIEIIRAAASG